LSHQIEDAVFERGGQEADMVPSYQRFEWIFEEVCCVERTKERRREGEKERRREGEKERRREGEKERRIGFYMSS
jgi:hypothetical protein